MVKKKAKQKFKKKAILKLIKGKTLDQVVENLLELKAQGYGDCKIEVNAQLSSGPGYWRNYTGKIKCNLLIPEEEK